MGTNNSRVEFLKNVDAGNEAEALKYAGKGFDPANSVYLYTQIIGRRMYRLLEETARYKHFDHTLVKTCTDAKCIEAISKSAWVQPSQFANIDMLMVYFNAICTQEKHSYLERYIGDTDTEIIDRLARYFESLEYKTITSISRYCRSEYLKNALKNATMNKKRSHSILAAKNIMEGKKLGLESDYYGRYDIDYNYIHENESLLMIALKHGYTAFAEHLIPRVDLSYECKGRNALHYSYAGGYTILSILIIEKSDLKWDIEFVTTDLTIMKILMKKFRFNRPQYIRIFTRMISLAEATDEGLKSFYELIRESIAEQDIPDLLKALDGKFPLTYDKLHAVIKPSKLEAEIAALKALLNVSVMPAPPMSSPPAYQEN